MCNHASRKAAQQMREKLGPDFRQRAKESEYALLDNRCGLAGIRANGIMQLIWRAMESGS